MGQADSMPNRILVRSCPLESTYLFLHLVSMFGSVFQPRLRFQTQHVRLFLGKYGRITSIESLTNEACQARACACPFLSFGLIGDKSLPCSSQRQHANALYRDYRIESLSLYGLSTPRGLCARYNSPPLLLNAPSPGRPPSPG